MLESRKQLRCEILFFAVAVTSDQEAACTNKLSSVADPDSCHQFWHEFRAGCPDTLPAPKLLVPQLVPIYVQFEVFYLHFPAKCNNVEGSAENEKVPRSEGLEVIVGAGFEPATFRL